MKCIGLLGGMSWESTLEYYRIINETVKRKLGETHSAECLVYSVDFDPLEGMQHREAWGEIAALLSDRAVRLKAAGAEILVPCTNTMHRVAEEIEAKSGLDLLHIADVTAAAIRGRGLHRVGLLGTRFTMEEDFYTGRLERSGISVAIPTESRREDVHRVIYRELCLGRIEERSRRLFLDVIGELVADGAQGVVLGCTEIPLLVKQEHSAVPLFDTTAIHARAAVEWALGP